MSSRPHAPRHLKSDYQRAAWKKDSVTIRRFWRKYSGYDWGEFTLGLPSDVIAWLFKEWQDASPQ